LHKTSINEWLFQLTGQFPERMKVSEFNLQVAG
jgi:hypothetical protein